MSEKKQGFYEVSLGVVVLRKFLNSVELSIGDVASYLEISETQLRNIVKGYSLPSEKMQRKLNPLLGLVNDWVLCDEQYENERNLKTRGL